METKRNGQNGQLTTGHDVYEVRPRKGRDGVDLQRSVSIRSDLVCRTRRGPQRGCVREVPRPVALAPSNYPRVGRLRRLNPEPLNVRAIFRSGETRFRFGSVCEAGAFARSTKGTADTQPQLHPALVRLSATISQ